MVKQGLNSSVRTSSSPVTWTGHIVTRKTVSVSAFHVSVAQIEAAKGRYECTNSLNLNHTHRWGVSGAVN